MVMAAAAPEKVVTYVRIKRSFLVVEVVVMKVMSMIEILARIFRRHYL
jgi:hypothetical protein